VVITVAAVLNVMRELGGSDPCVTTRLDYPRKFGGWVRDLTARACWCRHCDRETGPPTERYVAFSLRCSEPLAVRPLSTQSGHSGSKFANEQGLRKQS
jgi:hypothetical protein